ncbi:MAG: thioredoxin domain-containing protein [bacterium]
MSRTLLLALVSVALACGGSKPEPRSITVRDLIAERALSGARPDSFTSAADHGRISGDSTAKVWVVVVSDFQCDECKRWYEQVFPVIRNEYVATGRVRVAFLSVPQPAHLNGVPSALAAACASQQGKFWETADRIFATQAQWKGLPDARPFLDSLAIAGGADATRQRLCTERALGMKLIRTDTKRAEAAGVDSVPTFFVGSHKLVGRVSIASLRATLDSVLAGK